MGIISRRALGKAPLIGAVVVTWSLTALAATYNVVDTGQTDCYNNSTAIAPPSAGSAFYGQDAQHSGNQPSYTTSGDGLTVHDNVTGLTWMQSPDTNFDGSLTHDDKLTYQNAVAFPATLNTYHDGNGYGGYTDWRLPTVKELYSLINHSGVDLNPSASTGTTPFIDTSVFGFAYGFIGESAGNGPGGTPMTERIIDSQWATSTLYVAKTDQMFGVNFADGRIKGYPVSAATAKPYHVLCVRGNTSYGINQFVDNGDGTITDDVTGLMWSQGDSGEGLNWKEALAWVQEKNAENYLGHDDWRLPDAKELQSIVDYARSPDTTASAAIDPLFTCTQITNPNGQADYGFYWSSTTHVGESPEGTLDGNDANYVAFGRALGFMNNAWRDVHGAGAQRSDPKSGDPGDYPYGRGPQGDAIGILNFVRLVRDADGPTGLRAEFTWSPANPTAGQRVKFNNLSSGNPTAYSWKFGDGRASTAKSPTHRYSKARSYTARLTVRNSSGSSRVTKTIRVGPRSAEESSL
ncbi:MAG: DUF1566 domain-containing protein [Acidobacteriota bacterium]